MKAGNKQAGPRLRIVLDPHIAIGPGKADILQAIKETGSIAAAGRRMGMSYKRAWSLIGGMNRDFVEPLVKTTKGGKTRGGTELTETGDKVLALYRQMQSRAEAAIESDLQTMRGLLADMSE